MDKKREDDIFYVCTMKEYVARITNNHRKYIVECLDEKNIRHELRVAEVNHCLSFEQVADEWIERYNIKKGNYDTVKECKYDVPEVTAIGRVYQQLILDTINDNDDIKAVKNVFSSFLSDKISDFNSNIYYSNPSYLKCSYEAGELLD